MRFQVTMMNPFALHDAIEVAVTDSLYDRALSAEERESLINIRSEEVRSLCRKWFKYHECLTVEVDTEAKTCVVVPAQ